MLSIIIPTLNEEKYLPKLLGSLKSQDYNSYEIIISDGDSIDSTQKITREHKCNLVTSKKRSPGHQRNKGVMQAKGDILLFIDADTILPDNFLSTVMEEFKNRDLNIAGFYFIFDSKGLFYKLCSLFYEIFCFLGQYIKPISIGAGLLVKKEYHEKVNGFDETIHIGEDHEYSQRISKIGKFRIIRSKKIYYSVRRFENEGRFRTVLKWLYCALYFIVKGPIRKDIVEYNFGKY